MNTHSHLRTTSGFTAKEMIIALVIMASITSLV
jgi:prepilin-type N-terminal cleavage/methylation domain-containing protein